MALSTIIASCAERRAEDAPNGKDSSLAEVKIPSHADIEKKYGDKAKLLTGFVLEVKPDLQGCKGALSQTQKFETALSLKVTVQQGCSYTFFSDVGTYDDAKKVLTKSIFSNRVDKEGKALPGYKLAAKDFENKPTFTVQLKLDVTKDGLAAGFTSPTINPGDTDLTIQIGFGENSSNLNSNNNNFDLAIAEAFKVRDAGSNRDVESIKFEKTFEDKDISGQGEVIRRDLVMGYYVLRYSDSQNRTIQFQVDVKKVWNVGDATFEIGKKVKFSGKISSLYFNQDTTPSIYVRASENLSAVN